MISKEEEEIIVEFNQKLGLKTEFIGDADVLGYSFRDVIYINGSKDVDYDKINKHEVLHFYTTSKEFCHLKKYIFKKYKDKIREYWDDYYLRYCSLYTMDEIKMGVIDDEIAIDLVVDDFPISLDKTLRVGDLLFGTMKRDLDRKRYLNLNIQKNFDYMKFSKWEKIFIMNYYDGKEHVLPSYHKYERIRNDIELELTRLYSLAQDRKTFIIYPTSQEVVREYEAKIRSLKQRGEESDFWEDNRDYFLEKLASNFSSQLYEEYKHIVDYMVGTKFPKAFKVVILRETLLRIYKIVKDGEKSYIVVEKRDLNRSISSHMIINDVVLEVLYKNVDNYHQFRHLYFRALEIYRNKITKFSTIKLDYVETYGMGRWVKFNGKLSNVVDYIENANWLAALVKDTPWCTRILASSQLAFGDFYVFVDNDNKSHIAIKMIGNSIDEIRGILNGCKQELESEYRKVVISFLKNNREIRNGLEWLEAEEWNERLVRYAKRIDDGSFTNEDMPALIEDFCRIDYKRHGFGENVNKINLRNKLCLIKDKFSFYFNCKEDEICCGEIDEDLETLPYVVIVGDVDFGYLRVKDLGQVRIIIGNVNFGCSLVTDLANLEVIVGNVDFIDSDITNLANLRIVAGNAYFIGSEVRNLSDSLVIMGDADFRGSKVEDLDNIYEKVFGKVYFDDYFKKVKKLK